jgi:putative transposase
LIGQPRSTHRREAVTAEDETRLVADIVALATTYGRYGYRRITALLRQAGWVVNAKRVERRAIVRHRSEDDGERRREGLKVPKTQPKRGAGYG